MVDIIEIDNDNDGTHSSSTQPPLQQPSHQSCTAMHQSPLQSSPNQSKPRHHRVVRNPYVTKKATCAHSTKTELFSDGSSKDVHQSDEKSLVPNRNRNLIRVQSNESHAHHTRDDCSQHHNGNVPQDNQNESMTNAYYSLDDDTTRTTKMKVSNLKSLLSTTRINNTSTKKQTEKGNSNTSNGASSAVKSTTQEQREDNFEHSTASSHARHDYGRFSTMKQCTETPIIDPSLYKPLTHAQLKPDPVVNYFSIKNRPLNSRRMKPVSTLFQPPISNFWKSKWHSFNHMQSELSQVLSQSDDNIVVSAPTGAGKTCVFEMAIGRLFQNQMDKHQPLSDSCKIIYISPSKALCQERYDDWTARLKTIHPNLACVMLTGDSSESYTSIRDVESAHLILTTPEKWDLITRKWTDNFFLIGSVKLILIDEVHFIGTADRGACLEAVICRMKTVQRAVKAHRESQRSMNDHGNYSLSNTSMRVVAVSATLPNVVDIAAFLDANQAYVFDSTYRPVPLTTHVVGLGYIGKNQFLFDKGLNRHIPDLIKRFSQGRSTIIFCHTKKQTEILATELLASVGRNDPSLSRLAQFATLPSLRKCLGMAVAFHHAGMESDDRKMVEEHFSKGLIKCLCATSTLAMGVNLPAHLVIIKGTSVWRGTGQGYQEIDSGTLLQMMGRAGRPGFDKSGTAVIMTDTKSKPRYEQMSNGLEVVESMLLKDLTETLNIEISQRVISSVKEAVDWIKGTFFFIRVRKNPKQYGIRDKNDVDIESFLMKNCMDSIRNLCQTRIINLCERGHKIEPRKASHVMSRHMIPFQGMKAIVELPHDSGTLQLLHCLSNMEGIQYPVRRSEKSLLNDAHKLIKFKLEGGPPSKTRVQTPNQKAFVLLQAAIGQHFFNDFTLRQEMSSSIEFASRVLSATEDFSIEESKHGQIALEAMLLRRCLATSLWSSNDRVLNQLRGVGAKSAAKLAMNNIRTFNDIISKSSNDIEQACGRKSPFGQELKRVVAKIVSKSLKLTAFIEGLDCNEKPNELVCNVDNLDAKSHADDVSTNVETGVVTYTLAVHTDRPNGSLMFRTDISGPCSHRVRCPQKFGRIYIHLVSNLVGLDDKFTIDGNDTVQKSKFVLSPQKPKSSIAKNAKRSKSPKSNQTNLKPSSNKLENMVKGVQDFRLAKVSTTPSNNQAPKTGGNQGDSSSVANMQVSPMQKRKEPYVTPSPLQTTKSRVSLVGAQKTFPSSVPTRPPPPPQRKLENSIIREPKRHNMYIGSWNKQKKRQKRFQQRAFGSPKENPFSMFKFDPNNVEKQLELASGTSSEMATSSSFGPSVLPPTTSHGVHQQKMKHAARRSRFHSNIGLAPSEHSVSKLVGSSKRRKVSTPIQMRQPDLLRQKAAEQQSYIMTSRQCRSSQYYDLYPNDIGLSSKDEQYDNEYDSQPFGSVVTTGKNVEMNQFVNYHQQDQHLDHSQGVVYVSPTPINDNFGDTFGDEGLHETVIHDFDEQINAHVDQDYHSDEHINLHGSEDHFFPYSSAQLESNLPYHEIPPANYAQPNEFLQQNQVPDFVKYPNDISALAMDDSHRNDSNMEGLVINVASNDTCDTSNNPREDIKEAVDGFDLAFF